MTTGRSRLAEAIRKAIGVYVNGAEHSDLAEQRLIDRLGIELSSGWSRIPAPYHEDLDAFLYALLAVRVIGGCTDNYDRDAALRLLYEAAQSLQEHRFMESFDLPADAPPDTPIPRRLIPAVRAVAKSSPASAGSGDSVRNADSLNETSRPETGQAHNQN